VVAAQQRADREADVAAIQTGGGHLVEQRLERVEVVLVHHRELDRRSPQAAGHANAAEAGADHHHPGLSHRAATLLPLASTRCANMAG
jgi:hypothetical protein